MAHPRRVGHPGVLTGACPCAGAPRAPDGRRCGSRYPGAFTERMNRLDSLYFVITVFATVGFGDITAASGGPGYW